MARKARKRPTVRRAASRPKRSAPLGKGRRSASSPSRPARRAATSKTRRAASSKKRAAKPARATRTKAKAPKKTAKRPAAAKRTAAKRSPARGAAPAKTTRAKKPAKPAPASVKPATKRPRAARDAKPARPIHALSLDRNRRHLPEFEDNVPTPPSSLDLDRTPSAARSGRQGMRDARMHHNEVSPEITGGDVDASWEDAYSTGDEAPGGDNPTPDQDRVDDIGKALGVQYRGQRGTQGRRQDRRARPPPLGTRPGVSRRLPGT